MNESSWALWYTQRGGGIEACVVDAETTQTYNPGQNYLRKFSPSCPLSYATKLFPKWRLCGKKTPSPNSMLLPTNAQGSGFLLNTQQHCFQGKGEREEPVQLQCLEKCRPSIHFLNSFVQDCVQGDSRFHARIFARTKQKCANKKHFTEGVLSVKFHATLSSHRKARPHTRFLQHPL